MKNREVDGRDAAVARHLAAGVLPNLPDFTSSGKDRPDGVEVIVQLYLRSPSAVLDLCAG